MSPVSCAQALRGAVERTRGRVVGVAHKPALPSPRHRRDALCARASCPLRWAMDSAQLDARSLWRGAWRELRPLLTYHPRPGVLAVCFDEDGGLRGHAFTPIDGARETALIVGRHERCGLRLPSDRLDLSLRHLAVLVHGGAGGQVSITALDLCSGLGMHDEHGRRRKALSAVGSMFLRLGSLWFALLVSEQEGGWPKGADAAYELLPTRVYGGRLRLRPGTRPAAPVAGQRSVTLVRALPGPVLPITGWSSARRPVASVELRRGPLFQTLKLSRSLLARGVIVGRDERCQGWQVLEKARGVSRVHALLIDQGLGPLLVDVASTGGLQVDGADVPAVYLEAGVRVELAGEVGLRFRARLRERG